MREISIHSTLRCYPFKNKLVNAWNTAIPNPSCSERRAAASVSFRNMSISENSHALDRTVRMLDRASSQTAVAFSDCACDRLLIDRNALPNTDMNSTANGTDTRAMALICGEIKNNEIPPPINWAMLRSPCETHCLKHDLKSWTSAVNRFTSSPVRFASKNAKSWMIICLNRSCRSFAAICSPIWLSSKM